MTEQQGSASEKTHTRGDIEQPEEAAERQTPEKAPGGPTERGQHPVEPAEGARQPGEGSEGTHGGHPIEPAEGARENASE